MNTPICDFVRDYAQKNPLRLHMPGHKGISLLGMEHLDLTEIDGADSLYEAHGIIAQSEANASALFDCPTFYSTEGSSQCIRAMLDLVLLYAKEMGKAPQIMAARNAHKTFLTALALLDLQVEWLSPGEHSSYLSCDLSPEALEDALEHAQEKPVAVYLTSPDYLGRMADIAALGEVCHRHGVLLVVDNAHGAYLKFLPQSLHPMDLGADLCCASAHKTLPALTGGAYLHLSERMNTLLGHQVKHALSLFGSTSPSYLILQSLDGVNGWLPQLPDKLNRLLPEMDACKSRLTQQGYTLYGHEPLKLTILSKPYGYTGTQLADLLRQQNIAPEFADPDHLVLMLSTDPTSLPRLEEALCHIPKRPPLTEQPPAFHTATPVMGIREAMLSPSEVWPVEQCLGRVLAMPSVGCPPAVPILVCGDRIDTQAIACFQYYGIHHCTVVKTI